MFPLLTAAVGLAFVGALAALAVQVQWALFRSFDLAIAAAITLAAELTCAFSLIAHKWGIVGLLGSCIVTALVNSALFRLWNDQLMRRERHGVAVSRLLLVASLCLSTCVSGAVVLFRGPGTRSQAWSDVGILVPSWGVCTAAAMVTVLSCGLLVGAVRFGGDSQIAWKFRLWSQNAEFAEELGVDRNSLSLFAACAVGVATAIVGCWIATANGSSPDVGFSYFLTGAGGALLFGRPKPGASILGGAILGVFAFTLQLVVAPSVASLVMFLVVAVLLLLRGSSRDSEELR